ncbi:uncharacterized protein AB675_7610 [Cyphellophora attinorum]|uniref:Uncharacterized protein n=1 Tax=Cyphellophora attinorum TaxID=1664694 RepID=A0A0N1HA40_9EURO|nr:uncharacterized protein AB675_7610 [Phialophora attinorum]KPI40595.1 hypothetical protein AB675_7610 [Phialophora attinorum]
MGKTCRANQASRPNKDRDPELYGEFKASRYFVTHFGVLEVSISATVRHRPVYPNLPHRLIHLLCEEIAKKYYVPYVRQRGLPRILDVATDEPVYPSLLAEWSGRGQITGLQILDPKTAGLSSTKKCTDELTKAARGDQRGIVVAKEIHRSRDEKYQW